LATHTLPSEQGVLPGVTQTIEGYQALLAVGNGRYFLDESPTIIKGLDDANRVSDVYFQLVVQLRDEGTADGFDFQEVPLTGEGKGEESSKGLLSANGLLMGDCIRVGEGRYCTDSRFCGDEVREYIV
jgi:hypothetical protein